MRATLLFIYCRMAVLCASRVPGVPNSLTKLSCNLLFFERCSPRMMCMNIFGTLIALFICLSDVSCQRRECLGNSNYCPGQFGALGAICRDGYCVCTGRDYDYNTCLGKLFCFVLMIFAKITIFNYCLL